MEPGLSSADRIANGFIAAVQLFLTGFFAWHPLMYMLIFARIDLDNLELRAVPTLLLALLCTAIIIAFSILFAARAFKGGKVRNLARVMAVVNSFIFFLFNAFMLMNPKDEGLASLLFFVVVMATVLMPLMIVTAAVAVIGFISLLLHKKVQPKA